MTTPLVDVAAALYLNAGIDGQRAYSWDETSQYVRDRWIETARVALVALAASLNSDGALREALTGALRGSPLDADAALATMTTWLTGDTP